MKILFLIGVSMILLGSCKKNIDVIHPFADRLERDCAAAMKYGDFTSNNAPYSFKGLLDGQAVGFGDNTTETTTAIMSFADTTKRTFDTNLSGQYPSEKLWFGAQPPNMYTNNAQYRVRLALINKQDSSVEKLLDIELKVGDLKMRKRYWQFSAEEDKISGWDVRFETFCTEGQDTINFLGKNVRIIPMNSINESQNNNYIRCKSVVKKVTDAEITYDAEFEIQCDLYRDFEGKMYWKRLTNGYLKTQIIIRKKY